MFMFLQGRRIERHFETLKLGDFPPNHHHYTGLSIDTRASPSGAGLPLLSLQLYVVLASETNKRRKNCVNSRI
jgi:hypothetical protein